MIDDGFSPENENPIAHSYDYPFTRVIDCPIGMPLDIHQQPGWHDWSSGWITNLWYHASDAQKPFAIFCNSDEGSIGYHAGTHEAALHRHNEIFRMEDPRKRPWEGYLLPLIIRHRKAYRVSDLYDWRLDKLTSHLIEDGIITEFQEDQILKYCDPLGAFAALEVAGFDAILYANQCEGVKGEDSILVWRPENIRLAHAQAFHERSPLLCPSLRPSKWELTHWDNHSCDISEWIDRLTQNQWEDDSWQLSAAA